MQRPNFNKQRGFYLVLILLLVIHVFPTKAQNPDPEFIDPPREFSVMPFWFWNDTLKADELVRQIADFDAHGVYGFVIHPRMGLPFGIDFLDEQMLYMMKVAIEEARRRDMKVVLYDEGSYPSGSAEGQVVARNPEHAARGLAKVDLKKGEKVKLQKGWNIVTTGTTRKGKDYAIVERPSNGHIRGLHWIDEEKGKEHTPPAGDILNPEAVSSYIELVYDKFAEHFAEHFGETVIAIFTDEPDPLGRGSERGMQEGNAKLMSQVNEIVGYDFTPYLIDLWEKESNEWEKHRKDYHRALTICLERNYYGRLSKWCEDHNIALTGHPAKSTDLGAQKYFHIPGQDLVWRYVEPGEKALVGEHSTMAKNASSAMIHLNRSRNSNELYGAYGHELTHTEMVWLANWCFARGQNLLYPHAFYYSIRGARYDERPPDVGPNASWWPEYKEYADACRRLSWINSDSKHVCQVAVLGDANWLPYEAPKILFENQIDFNYLELSHLEDDVEISKEGVKIGDMIYKVVVLDGLHNIPKNVLSKIEQINEYGSLAVYKDLPGNLTGLKAKPIKSDNSLVQRIRKKIERDIRIVPDAPGIRYRHVVKNQRHYYILFNEVDKAVDISPDLAAEGAMWVLDEYTGKSEAFTNKQKLSFEPFELKIILVE